MEHILEDNRRLAHQGQIREQQDAVLQAQNDLATLLKTAEFRRFVGGLWQECSLDSISFDPDNERRGAFREGRRSIAVHIQQQIRALGPNGHRYVEQILTEE